MRTPDARRGGRDRVLGHDRPGRTAPEAIRCLISSRPVTALVVDCHDPERLAAFWCAVLGFKVIDRREGEVEIGS